MNPYLPKMSPTAGKGLGGLPRRATVETNESSDDWDGGWITPHYDSVTLTTITSPEGLFFKPDGKYVFVINTSNDRVHRYPLTIGWNLSTVGASDQNYTVNAQTPSPRGLFFNPVGTKMFTVDSLNSRVVQYTLTTGFDLSTTSYSGNMFSTVGQDTAPYDVQFNTDGSRMFLVGNTNDTIYQYDLASPWDLGTAPVYNSVSFSITTEETVPHGMCFAPNGLRFWLIGSTSDRIHQYSVPTAFNLTSAIYDKVCFAVNLITATPSGIVFKPDLKKLYITGLGGARVYELNIEGI